MGSLKNQSGALRALRRGWIVGGLLALLGAGAQAWEPNEKLVSSTPDLLDMEFSQSRGMLAWNDELGNLWIATVDRHTGDFYPADAKGILVDPDSMKFEDAQKTKNGPEWVVG